MCNELSELNLQEDIDKVLTCSEASRWGIQKSGPLEVFISLYPVNSPNDIYLARFVWQEYPEQPPSLKFCDIESKRIDMPTAWPIAHGFRPSSLDACVNWTKEGLDLHPEWKDDPKFRWDSRGNVLLKVLRYLQEELDTTCQGRFNQ